jgi:hypothetical protein
MVLIEIFKSWRNSLGGWGLDYFLSERGQAGPCKHGNEIWALKLQKLWEISEGLLAS